MPNPRRGLILQPMANVPTTDPARDCDHCGRTAPRATMALDADPDQATKPQVLASRIVTMLDRQHAFLINRNKAGSMALPGESLFVLEMAPASYAILATNEAEKAAAMRSRAKAMEILASFKIKHLSEAKPSHYPAIKAALDEIVAGAP